MKQYFHLDLNVELYVYQNLQHAYNQAANPLKFGPTKIDGQVSIDTDDKICVAKFKQHKTCGNEFVRKLKKNILIGV